MRKLLLPVTGALALSLVLYVAGCSKGSTSYSPTTPTPTPSPTPTPTPGPTPAGNIAITIVGMNGNNSFNPSSVTVNPGQTVAWTNRDSMTHRIRQDGGAFDTGDIPPGATSAPITVTSTAAMPYHCTIHPSMVGGINTDASTPAPGPVY